MLACECLNVIIESETEGQKVAFGELQLTEDEVKDPFFRQEIEQLGKLIKINKAHSGLIQTRIVGPWIVHYCLNCGMNTHAVHQQRGAAFVLVASRLLKKETVDALQKSDSYSTIYKIIVNPHEHDGRPVDDIPRELESTVSNLKQIASDILTREAAAAEERIRLFTEKETIALDALRERALSEHKVLVRKLVSSANAKPTKNIPTERTSLNSPKAKAQKLPDSFPSGTATSQPISIKAKQSPLSGNVVRARKITKRTTERRVRHTSSVDAEGMFQFDTTDEEETTFQSELDESDSEDIAREGASKDRSPTSIAKSLPMDIPVFMSSFQNHMPEDADDSLPSTEDTLDIAASIKALAKSVHGDTIFGDLPRPRFSTQI